MKLPQGFTSPKPNQVCLLQKSVYGLKQASRQWFSKLSTALLSCHYTQSPSDHSLFIKSAGSSFTALLVYVDDVILTGNDLNEIAHIKQFLDNRFKIKDLGNLKFFLGLEVARSNSGISLCQRKYALELVADAGLLGCKPATTPMDCTLKLSNTTGSPLADATSYRRLIYLTTTRPELSTKSVNSSPLQQTFINM